MEDSKFVKDITEKEGKKKYWQITWHDDKKDNIFNPDWLKLLEQAHLENRIVDFKKEKNGNYWNITELKLGDFTEAPKLTEPKDKMTPDMWDEKDRVTRLSIESQVAVKCVMEAFSAGQLKEDSPYVKAALGWAMKRIGKPIEERTVEIDGVEETPTPTPKPAPKSTTEPNKQKEEVSLNNPGEFYTVCHKLYGINKTQVDTDTVDLDLSVDLDRVKAWSIITRKYGK